MKSLRLASSVRAEIIAHSLDDAPLECCGLIGGVAGQARSIHRTRNSFESPSRYAVHPTDQLRSINAIEDAGEQLVAIYHSHTRSPAWPSPTDINLARNWPDPVYLICSVFDPDTIELRGFLLGGGGVEEVEIASDV